MKQCGLTWTCRHVNISSCLWSHLVTEVPVGIWISSKIDRSAKTPWKEYGVVEGSWWWAPAHYDMLGKGRVRCAVAQILILIQKLTCTFLTCLAKRLSLFPYLKKFWSHSRRSLKYLLVGKNQSFVNKGEASLKSDSIDKTVVSCLCDLRSFKSVEFKLKYSIATVGYNGNVCFIWANVESFHHVFQELRHLAPVPPANASWWIYQKSHVCYSFANKF